MHDEKCLSIYPRPGASVEDRRLDYSVGVFRNAEAALRESGLSLHQVDLFAVSNGPGAFTGIRVGMAAAQAWAYALEKPWRGVSILEAMAEASGSETCLAMPILDARRGEFYAAIIERGTAHDGPEEHPWDPVGGGVLLRPEGVAAYLAAAIAARDSRECLVITREGDAAAAGLKALMTGRPNTLWTTVAPCLIPAIARLAFRAHAARRPIRPEETTACYVRRTDAELHLNELAAAPRR